MVSLSFYVGCYCLALFQTFVAASPLRNSVPRLFQRNPATRHNLTSADVQQELGPQLSHGSLIFGPSSPLYPDATERWVTFAKPDIEVVVQPALESDIAKIVKYCDANSIEFLVRNRGHGGTTSLAVMKGLEIDMKLLQGMTFNENERTAVLQGGTYAGPVIRSLWDKGYGEYGLVADGVVHFNVVLADGSSIGVNETSHPDLFWAMRGAGHNFGVVTSYTANIHPVGYMNWHYHNYTWTGDKLESVFEQLNVLHNLDNGSTPVLMSYTGGSFLIDPTISTSEAIIDFTFAYHGPATDAEALLAPFNKIEAVRQEMGDVSYPELAAVQGTVEDSPGCDSAPFVIGSNMLINYNVTVERQIYDLFNKYVARYPGIGNAVSIIHEGYATKAVHEIPSDSTAYPHREDNHLVVFLGALLNGTQETPMRQWAKETHDLWTAGKPSRRSDIYVNYASGSSYESLESIYGYESWRLPKLRALKAKYDPHNRFGYYAPI
ncbi:FAD-binding domain-containing protein [Xylariaceae sp. AK1471]|nr:FAD-binding domain-containing protein [Xylariaceae sp. AK1471]